MRARLMDRTDNDETDAVLTHSAHQQTLNALIGLMRDLHACGTPEDLYAFQNQLRDRVVRVEKHRSAISQQIKRLHRHQKISADAPELGTTVTATRRRPGHSRPTSTSGSGASSRPSRTRSPGKRSTTIAPSLSRSPAPKHPA